MKLKRIGALLGAVALMGTMVCSGIGASAANADLDTSQKVSFTATCNKEGYTFDVYKVASLNKTTTNPFDVKYTATIASLQDEIDAGIATKKDGTLTASDWASAPAANQILAACDALTLTQLGTSVGTFTPTSSATSKTFSNLDQGIYYVRATACPATVKSTVNSLFALPYYDSTNGWTYTINTIPLASKVSENVPAISKKIVKGSSRVDYDNLSLGDTVTYEIVATPMGSTQHKMTELKITDTCCEGITLGSTVDVALYAGGTKTKDLSSGTDYTYSNGVITFTSAFLSADDVYSADNIIVKLTGTVNEKATVVDAGNDNTSSYTWKVDGVSNSKNDSEETKVYTQKLQLKKTNEAGTALAGAEFAIYSDAACTTTLGTGTSDSSGNVVFKNTNGKELLLKTGTYYVKETKAPANYNRYSDVITVVFSAQYASTFTNNTWLSKRTATANGSAITMTNGTAQFTVTNSKVVLPQTGGVGNMFIYIIAGIVAAVGVGTIIAVTRKKAQDK